MTEIPQWAFKRAEELYQKMAFGVISVMPPRGRYDVKAFARYIAEHEEAPLDPLLEEARGIAEKATNYAFTDGNNDTADAVVCALAALKSREAS